MIAAEPITLAGSTVFIPNILGRANRAVEPVSSIRPNG